MYTFVRTKTVDNKFDWNSTVITSIKKESFEEIIQVYDLYLRYDKALYNRYTLDDNKAFNTSKTLSYSSRIHDVTIEGEIIGLEDDLSVLYNNF